MGSRQLLPTAHLHTVYFFLSELVQELAYFFKVRVLINSKILIIGRAVCYDICLS